MTQSVERVADKVIEEARARFSTREKALAFAGCVVTFGFCWLSGNIFHIPAYLHYSAAMVQQQALLASLLVTLIIYCGSVLISGLIARIVGFDAGVFCASVGLCALSIRGGGMRYTLFEAAGA